MPNLTTKDGASIYYKDWGAGQPILFSHGWPLTADAWDSQMEFLANNGFRCIAHDRRGHGRSSQPWLGNDMNTYADDLATLINYLDVNDVILVGHSTGGGEVARYISHHGAKRVAKAVLIGSVTPHLLSGLPLANFDGIRAKVHADRSQFFLGLPDSFYGAQITEGLRRSFWLQGMQASHHAAYACVEAFSATDFTLDLAQMKLPTLVIHGDADQIVPIAVSAHLTIKLLPSASLIVYPGAPHGLCATHQEQLNTDLLAFCHAQ
jgi:non-heme chloroperoxidase